MAGMDFPASPTAGASFVSGGTTWIYDGVAWNISPGVGPVIVSDNTPLNPADGQMWWRSNMGILYIYFNDGTSKQWVQAAGAPQAAPAPAPVVTRDLIFSGAVNSITTWQRTGLDAYMELYLGIDLAPDSVAGTIKLQLSEDNGATWIAGTNYSNQIVAGNSAANSNGQQLSTAQLYLGGGQTIQPAPNTIGICTEYVFKRFNKAAWTRWQSFGGAYTSGGLIFAISDYGAMVRLNPCNGILITASSATSGYLTLEGIKG